MFYSDKVAKDSSTAKNEDSQSVKRGVAQPFHNLSPCFGRLKAPENPASEGVSGFHIDGLKADAATSSQSRQISISYELEERQQ